MEVPRDRREQGKGPTYKLTCTLSELQNRDLEMDPPDMAPPGRAEGIDQWSVDKDAPQAKYTG